MMRADARRVGLGLVVLTLVSVVYRVFVGFGQLFAQVGPSTAGGRVLIWTVVGTLLLLIFVWSMTRGVSRTRATISGSRLAGVVAGISLVGAVLGVLVTHVILATGPGDYLNAERFLVIVSIYWLLALVEGVVAYVLVARRGLGLARLRNDETGHQRNVPR